MRRTAPVALCVVILISLVISACTDLNTPYPLAITMTLKSVSMVSSHEGWAVGLKSGAPNDVLLHFSKGQWTIVKPLVEQTKALPGMHTVLTGVAMVSTSEGWAIGSNDIPTSPLVTAADGTKSQSVQLAGVLLHYTQGQWRVANGKLDMDMHAIKMLSPTQGWILGTTYNEEKAELLQYDGSQWKPIALPPMIKALVGGLNALSVVNPNDIWLTGLTGSVFHYDGHSWTQQSICTDCGLLDITMISAHEGWAVGSIFNSDVGVIYHYQYGQWSLQSNAQTHGLDGVVMLSNKEGWATGGSTDMLHYINGQWVPVSMPTKYGVSQISMVSGTEGWAVGQHGVILHYQNGTWNEETNVNYEQGALDIYTK